MDDEKHKAALWNRVADLKLKDLMTLSEMVINKISDKLDGKDRYPMEITTVILRETSEPGIWEQRIERWSKNFETLQEAALVDKPLKELQSSVGTGRMFRFIRNISGELPHGHPDLPTKTQTVFLKPEDFTVDIYEQISGTPDDLGWGVKAKSKWD